MQKMARGLKRLAIVWSEKGAKKMCRIVLKRFTDRAGWETWWHAADGLQLTYRGVKTI